MVEYIPELFGFVIGLWVATAGAMVLDSGRLLKYHHAARVVILIGFTGMILSTLNGVLK